MRLILACLAALAFVLAAPGCRTTRFNERARIADHAMELDADPALIYFRAKVESAREGALGGFGRSAAGGCGCE